MPSARAARAGIHIPRPSALIALKIMNRVSEWEGCSAFT